MRYIRKYNEAKSIVDTNNLGDILDDLVDLGHVCRVQSDWWSDRSCYEVVMLKFWYMVERILVKNINKSMFLIFYRLLRGWFYI